MVIHPEGHVVSLWEPPRTAGAGKLLRGLLALRVVARPLGISYRNFETLVSCACCKKAYRRGIPGQLVDAFLQLTHHALFEPLRFQVFVSEDSGDLDAAHIFRAFAGCFRQNVAEHSMKGLAYRIAAGVNVSKCLVNAATVCGRKIDIFWY